MGGWALVLAAGGLWVGVLFSGLGAGGPTLPEAFLLIAVGTAALLMIVATSRHRLHPAVLGAWIAISFAFVGAGWAGLRAVHVNSSPLIRLAGGSVPAWGTLGSDLKEGPLGWTATLRTELVFPGTPGWPRVIRVHDPLWLEGHGRPPSLTAGDRVRLRGSIGRLHGSFGDYLRHRGYPATYFVDEISSRGPPSNLVSGAAEGLRSTLRRSLARVFPNRDAGLVMGLTLGDTSRLDPQVQEAFRATGLSHLTAVSGENLAMFLAPVLGLGVLAGLGRRGRFLLGLGAVGFFALLTRAEPSVMRAAAMSGLTLLGVFMGRPRSAPAIMGGAVLVLLAINPTVVYAIGFQLSVAATAGMALLATPLAQRLRFAPKGIALAAGATIGAQAGVTPLLLYHFGAVPTVSIPANLLAFPAVAPGMLLGLAAAGAGLLWHPLGLAVAAAARLPLGYLQGLASRLARSPLPSITSAGKQMLVTVIGIGAVAGVGWWLRSGRRLAGRTVIALGLAAPLLLWSVAVRAGPPTSLTVTFFDVGQGDAALIRSPGGASILIDGGPDSQQVATKLASLGVRRLDLLVATHPHADHVAGLPSVLARFPVTLVLDPGCRGSSPFYAAFLHALRSSGVPLQHPRPGAVLRVGDVRVEVLGPARCYFGTDSDPNNDSLVLRVSEGPASVMFPGDSEQEAQTELLRDEPGLLTAAVLKVPHHGGDTSLDRFFLGVQARVAIVSVGPNRYGHPARRILSTLAADGMRVFRTDRSGDVTVTFAGDAILVRASEG
jgi:competence protein ComEC